jgi:hypothetical protein
MADTRIARVGHRRLVSAIALLAALALPPAAQADIGFTEASRTEAAPGEQVRVTVECGFCYPTCVGRPGDRHPPGDPAGVCMLRGRGERPPGGFPIWLTAGDRFLGPYRCGPEMLCPAESARPPRLPEFTYLGRAELRSAASPNVLSRYVLRFRVPDVRPGPYNYVLFCESCVEGPRGSLIDNGTAAVGRLRVVPPRPGGGGAAGPWIAGGIAAAIVLPGVGLLLRRRHRAVARGD